MRTSRVPLAFGLLQSICLGILTGDRIGLDDDLHAGIGVGSLPEIYNTNTGISKGTTELFDPLMDSVMDHTKSARPVRRQAGNETTVQLSPAATNSTIPTSTAISSTTPTPVFPTPSTLEATFANSTSTTFSAASSSAEPGPAIISAESSPAEPTSAITSAGSTAEPIDATNSTTSSFVEPTSATISGESNPTQPTSAINTSAPLLEPSPTEPTSTIASAETLAEPTSATTSAALTSVEPSSSIASSESAAEATSSEPTPTPSSESSTAEIPSSGLTLTPVAESSSAGSASIISSAELTPTSSAEETLSESTSVLSGSFESPLALSTESGPFELSSAALTSATLTSAESTPAESTPAQLTSSELPTELPTESTTESGSIEATSVITSPQSSPAESSPSEPTSPEATSAESTPAPSAASRVPISNFVGPADEDLLTSQPDLVVRLLNDAAQHVSPNDPNVRGWQDYGCFTSSNLFNGTLASATPPSSSGMDPQICISLCAPQGADYSFVSGEQCYCSSTAPPPSTGSTQCQTPCTENESLTCGNPTIDGFSVFRRIIVPENDVPLPARAASGSFVYGGCFVANTFISTAELVISNTSGIDACSAAAVQGGFRYLGLQGGTCYASNTPPTADLEAGIGLCANPCPNNPLESCGGAIQQSNVFARRQVETQPTTPGDGTDLLITLYNASPSPVTDPPTPDTSATGPTGPSGWYVDGCFVAGSSILNASIYGVVYNNDGANSASNSGALCVSECLAAGFDYAFTQLDSCYCSNNPPTTPATTQTDCNQACPNNTDERCGGQGDPDSPGSGVFVNLYSRVLLDVETQVRQFPPPIAMP